MSASEALLFLLRLTHAAASLVWLGGGLYFAVGILPLVRSGEPVQRAVALSAQQRFGRWSKDATVALLGTGMILMFDRLSSGTGGLTYTAILALKVVSAVLAFLLVSNRWRQSLRARSGGLSTTRLVLVCGWVAFLLGVGLATYYGRGIA